MYVPVLPHRGTPVVPVDSHRLAMYPPVRPSVACHMLEKAPAPVRISRGYVARQTCSVQIAYPSAEGQPCFKCQLGSLPIACLYLYHAKNAVNCITIIHKALQGANALNICSCLLPRLQMQVPLSQKGQIEIATIAQRL